jgi:hypothetical protein
VACRVDPESGISRGSRLQTRNSFVPVGSESFGRFGRAETAVEALGPDLLSTGRTQADRRMKWSDDWVNLLRTEIDLPAVTGLTFGACAAPRNRLFSFLSDTEARPMTGNRDMRLAMIASALLAAAVAMPSIAKAADRRVEVVNASRQDLREFYASNTKRGSWEEDILGEDVLPPGRSITINIDDGSGACRFDFLAVLDGGRKVDVCEISRFTVR